MVMHGREYDAGGYRYGFNGKEKDSEWGDKESGNIYDYGFRIYNPAIGKFLSVDPLAPKYPWYTPYQFAGNMPISAIDLDGLEPASSTMNTDAYGNRSLTRTYANGNVVTDQVKTLEDGTDVVASRHKTDGAWGGSERAGDLEYSEGSEVYENLSDISISHYDIAGSQSVTGYSTGGTTLGSGYGPDQFSADGGSGFTSYLSLATSGNLSFTNYGSATTGSYFSRLYNAIDGCTTQEGWNNTFTLLEYMSYAATGVGLVNFGRSLYFGGTRLFVNVAGNSRVFWSGGLKEEAKVLANSLGGSTLEMTPIGKGLEWATKKIWL